MASGVVEDEVWKLCVGVDGEAEGGQGLRIVVDALAFGIAEVEDGGAGIPAGAEHFDDGFDELSPSDSLGAEGHTRKRPEHGSHEVSHRRRGEELSEFLLPSSCVCFCVVHAAALLSAPHPNRLKIPVTSFGCEDRQTVKTEG